MKAVTQSRKFATYSHYAKNWLIENEIKLKTVYVEDGNYNPNFIYINRIANCGKPKFRILQRGKDTVKNCLLITFNTERHDREYLCYLIQSKMHLLRFLAHGSCQTFINQDTLAQIISGAVDNKGFGRPELLG
jgi:hypothetical protein